MESVNVGQVLRREQFTQLYRDYRHLVWSVARSVLQDTTAAEDIVQEVFLRLNRLDDIEHPAAWLKRVAHRLALNYARDVKRRTRLIEKHGTHTLPFRDPDVIELLIAENLHLQCKREIEKLPDEFQDVAYRMLDGQKPHEIQKSLNLPPGTISSRVYRIRKRLEDTQKK
jgi:RNA polymerase sigma-70 factor (ECF subfamily)